MKKVLLVLLVLLSISSVAFAEKKITRDAFGNIDKEYSISTINYDDTFDVNVYFSGKTTNIKQDKTIIPMPDFYISFDFVCKISDEKELTKMKDIHFIDRSFLYKTSEMSKPLSSVTTPLSVNSDGHISFHKLDGEYNVYIDETEASVYQKKIMYYNPPRISISYNWKAAVPDQSQLNPHNKIMPLSDPVFAAWIYRALAYNYPITFSIPYSNDSYKDFDNYTDEDKKNIKWLTINISKNMVEEWQEVAKFKMPQP